MWCGGACKALYTYDYQRSHVRRRANSAELAPGISHEWPRSFGGSGIFSDRTNELSRQEEVTIVGTKWARVVEKTNYRNVESTGRDVSSDGASLSVSLVPNCRVNYTSC